MTREGRIIIIEGIDGVGKTTFATSLYEVIAPPVGLLHAGKPMSDIWTREYIMPLIPAAEHWTMICDRWHLGEPVWSAVFERETILPWEKIAECEQRLLSIARVEAFYLMRDEADVREQCGDWADIALSAIPYYERALKESTLTWQCMDLPAAMNVLDRFA